MMKRMFLGPGISHSASVFSSLTCDPLIFRFTRSLLLSFRDGAGAPGPESITTILSSSLGLYSILLYRDYGFRALGLRPRPGMTGGEPKLRQPVAEGRVPLVFFLLPSEKMRGQSADR